MQSLEHYTLILLDLDGLLVNTEELHFRAYQELARSHGYELDLDFLGYFRMAQQGADAPRNYFYSHFPKLAAEEPNWDVLYQEKKRAVLSLLERDGAPLLPGVETFLRLVEKMGKPCAIVTHSAKELVTIIRKKNPILDIIPLWITKGDYRLPKPSPEGYLKAIERCGAAGPIIGFEDSERGMEALLATPAQPVLINSFDADLRARYKAKGISVFRSFEELPFEELAFS